jgi:hypothetical protein
MRALLLAPASASPLTAAASPPCRRWEGITFDPTRNSLFTAMSAIREGMEDNKDGGEDDDA